MAADLKAATLQSKKADEATQLRQFEAAAKLWSLAVGQCEGRAKDRAQRNLDDDRKMLASLQEKLNAGPECAAAFKDAASLQEIARQALTERRWPDAAAFYRKAENTWDMATEVCTGSQQAAASLSREQTAQDGFNAEYCAPLFEHARDITQRFRAAQGGMSREDKLAASQAAETQWHKALETCRGAAVQEMAANNAKTLARDRGTPWVAKEPEGDWAGTLPKLPVPSPVTASATPTPVGTVGASPAAGTGPKRAKSAVNPAAAVAPMVATAAAAGAAAAVAAPAQASAGVLGALSGLLPAAGAAAGAAKVAAGAPPEPAPAAATTPAEPAKPGNLVAGSTRFTGAFAMDAGATTVSGTGKVSWANGDVFEGSLLHGQRQGRGTMTWANGQRYDGDWVQDAPTGMATLKFASGNAYHGQVVNGVPQGQGRMEYASGDVFEGQFKLGQPDQTGTYTWKNGQRYEGQWALGRPNGQGKMVFANGNRYEGAVANGTPHGAGKMQFPSGEIYEGQFINGQPEGQGRFVWPSGDEYVGQWRAGKKNGQGAFTWKSGERREGWYDNDQPVDTPPAGGTAAVQPPH
jgi:hypothetical protein